MINKIKRMICKHIEGYDHHEKGYISVIDVIRLTLELVCVALVIVAVIVTCDLYIHNPDFVDIGLSQAMSYTVLWIVTAGLIMFIVGRTFERYGEQMRLFIDIFIDKLRMNRPNRKK